jgi:hypothetical protein
VLGLFEHYFKFCYRVKNLCCSHIKYYCICILVYSKIGLKINQNAKIEKDLSLYVFPFPVLDEIEGFNSFRTSTLNEKFHDSLANFNRLDPSRGTRGGGVFLYLGIRRRTAGMGHPFVKSNISMGCNFHQSLISMGR